MAVYLCHMAKLYKAPLSDPSLVEDSAAVYASAGIASTDPYQIMVQAREGLSIARIQELIEAYPLSASDWAAFADIPVRTFYRHLRGSSPIHGASAERILSVHDLIETGIAVFGDVERFFSWIAVPRDIFRGHTAYELLPYDHGVRIVRDELGRIAHGVYI